MPPIHRLRLLPHPSFSLPSCITPLHLRRTFHSTLPSPQTHYETLNLHPSASASEIKTAFYRLSKLHHPDNNPTDPQASNRFIALSTAYSILSRPESRLTYDRQHRLHSSSSSNTHHSGSHHSASHNRHGGSRPASGLSRRKTQPKGPPPSYYSNGGGSDAWRAGPQGGVGRDEFGGQSMGEAPYFDNEGKKRQYEEHELRWERNKSMGKWRKGDKPKDSTVDLSDLFKAFSIMCVLGVTMWGGNKWRERQARLSEGKKKRSG